jgi:ketosteroid isomerase-like protein
VYKAAVRHMIRRTIEALNDGDYEPALKMFTVDATLTFPGRNSWSRQHREPEGGCEQFPTHRGRAEIETFLRQYVDHGIQMAVDDVLVNGPPWNTRVAARVHDWIDTPSGERIYANRAVMFARARWGRLVEQEDYEDTARVLEYEALVDARGGEVLSR